MSSVHARVVVQCDSCELGVALPAAPLVRLRGDLQLFFTEHEACETRIDLSQAPGLRLLPLPATAEHAHC